MPAVPRSAGGGIGHNPAPDAAPAHAPGDHAGALIGLYKIGEEREKRERGVGKGEGGWEGGSQSWRLPRVLAPPTSVFQCFEG